MNINFFAIFLCGIAYMVVGALWYSPLLFARSWMRYVGKTEEEIKRGFKYQMYLYSFLASLVMAGFLTYFMRLTGAEDIFAGMGTGLFVGLGFVLTTLGVTQMYEGKSVSLTFIDAGYQITALVIMGAIIALLS